MKIRVEISKRATKDIYKLPKNIADSLFTWIEAVEEKGIREVRKVSGYHDEPLQGTRFGQRSIRLNKAYRAIYILSEDNHLELITIIEVNKHQY